MFLKINSYCSTLLILANLYLRRVPKTELKGCFGEIKLITAEFQILIQNNLWKHRFTYSAKFLENGE